MMILIFKLIVITSIWVLGLTIVTQKGMALYNFRQWAETKKSLWFEPIILCEWCMPSIHSLIGYAIAIGLGVINHFSWSLVVAYILVVMGSSVVSGMTWALYSLIAKLIEYYSHVEKLAYFDVDDRKKAFQRRQSQTHN